MTPTPSHEPDDERALPRSVWMVSCGLHLALLLGLTVGSIWFNQPHAAPKVMQATLVTLPKAAPKKTTKRRPAKPKVAKPKPRPKPKPKPKPISQPEPLPPPVPTPAPEPPPKPVPAVTETPDPVSEPEPELNTAAQELALMAALEEEEHEWQAANEGKLDVYRRLVQQKVERNWLRPASAQANLRCQVIVQQMPGGDVLAVRFGECNADVSVKASIERAVRKASPLPKPPDPRLFERNVVLNFKSET